ARNVTTPAVNGPYVGTSPPALYLSQSSVSPSIGFSSDVIYFYVTYTHSSNLMPSSIYVKIDSTSYPMSKVYPYDNTYTDGCMYYCSKALGLGSHTFSFYASDGSTSVYSPTYSGLTVRSFASTTSLTQISCSPASGNTDSDFQFRVLYTQSYNLAPDFVAIYIDNMYNEMSKESSADNAYDDGCFYVYSTRLSAANHTYYFEASRSNDKISTNPYMVEVRAVPIINEPSSLFALVFIIIGSIATISTASIAYKIKAKKMLTIPLSMNAASTSRLSPGQPANTSSGSSRMVPAQGGWNGVSGGAIPVSPGFLPPSAFVIQPSPALPAGIPGVSPVPNAPARDATSPAGMPDSRRSSAPEPILPGSQKWMRLARFDISMYMAPLGGSDVNDVNAANDEPGLADDVDPSDNPTEDLDLENDTQLGEINFEDSMPVESVNEAALLAPEAGDDESPSIARPAMLVVRRFAAENLIHPGQQVGKSYLFICPACKKEISITGNDDGVLYDCRTCNRHLLYVATCIACQSRSEIEQDELQKARGGGIRCPVCWENINM
ncbi:MAG: hypothetical protein Q6373_013065, partial [Candidatus Sigynarchaeota archaeon]